MNPSEYSAIIADPDAPGLNLTHAFDEVGRHVLTFLRERVPMQLWTITRVIGDDWILLKVDDRGYGVKADTVLRWHDSFCSRMVRNEGPRFSPRVSEVPAYLEAPVGRVLPIGAYIGIPLRLPGGELFGTLCGIDPEPQPALEPEQRQTVELLGQLVSSFVALERHALDSTRQIATALEEAATDALTGLANRRGWDERLAQEEARLHVLGELACVIMIDLDDLKEINDSKGHAAGDELLIRAAGALRASVRQGDFVARIGGDEFAIVGISLDRAEADQLVGRLRRGLEQAGIEGSIGSAIRRQSRPLSEALALADQRMFENKQQRKAQRKAV
ncbi:MAG: diguanylate cyclase domain-containing protein [Wenzhouxiangella sp.]